MKQIDTINVAELDEISKKMYGDTASSEQAIDKYFFSKLLGSK